MGDAGEGLIDAEARIQERMDEMARERATIARRDTSNPESVRARESLRLARAELQQQLQATCHDRRRAQLEQAIEEVERRMAAIDA